MKPPPLADWLFCVLAPPQIRDVVLGDLHEEYAKYTVAELGTARARMWYWKQVMAVLCRYRSPARILSTPVNCRPALHRNGFPAPVLLRRLFVGSAIAGMVMLALTIGMASHARTLDTLREVGRGFLPGMRAEELADVQSRRLPQLTPDAAASEGKNWTYLEPAALRDAAGPTGRTVANGLANRTLQRQKDRVWLGW